MGETAKLSTTVAVHVNIATLSHPSLLSRSVSTGWIAGGGGSEIERKVQPKVTEVVPAFSGPSQSHWEWGLYTMGLTTKIGYKIMYLCLYY